MLFRDYKETVSQLSLQVLLALLNHVRLPTTATQSATPTPVRTFPCTAEQKNACPK